MGEHRHYWNTTLIDFTGLYHHQACLVPGCNKERRWRYKNGRLRLVRRFTGKAIVFTQVPLERLLRRTAR